MPGNMQDAKSETGARGNPVKRAAKRLGAKIAHSRARMSERLVRAFFPWANFY